MLLWLLLVIFMYRWPSLASCLHAWRRSMARKAVSPTIAHNCCIVSASFGLLPSLLCSARILRVLASCALPS